NTRYQAAIDEYLHEQEKPVGTKKCGLCVIAERHNVQYRTLGHLANGGQSISAFNMSKRKLTYPEECILVDFILESADHALPLTPKQIKIHANGILAY
ncbi:hypothetical protein L208DRAFT_1326268, partial [Tricholoma matsutake]